MIYDGMLYVIYIDHIIVNQKQLNSKAHHDGWIKTKLLNILDHEWG
jgi:hypothetical protein